MPTICDATMSSDEAAQFYFFISPELFHQLPLPAVVSPHPPVCVFYFDSFSLSRPLQVGGVCAAAKGGGQRENSRPAVRQTDRETGEVVAGS